MTKDEKSELMEKKQKQFDSELEYKNQIIGKLREDLQKMQVLGGQSEGDSRRESQTSQMVQLY